MLLVSYDLQLPENDAGQIAGQVRRFVEARQWGLPVYIAQAASIGAIDEHFELPGPIPVTLALDKDGRIVDRQEGEAEPARFEEMMRKALGL
ncbi:MAG: hypothetical protein EYC70_12510 [Planctomycetota bacterium]|nr:MAG: hypothetical protein EYC70_12510 [Planctomycetota bacterium]